jgi:hypothetical protein
MQPMVWSRAAAGLAIVILSSTAPSPRAAPVVRTDLRVEGRSGATPSIASDGDDVIVAWSASLPGGATDIFAATSRDLARSFSAPVRVNDVEGDARVNGEQPPRVAVARNVITIVWPTKGARGTKLLYARSSDGGRTFAKSTLVPGTDAAGNRGWQNLSGSSVVWLDHRELAKDDAAVESSHHDHAAMAAGAKPDGVAMAQKSRLYVAEIDGGSAPVAVTGGVCYCCKTAIATTPDGTIYAAWRHVYPGNIRDIAFTVSRDGGRTFAPPTRVSEDRWVLEGCPDDGPAMAVDRSGRIHVVWPTLVRDGAADSIALFYATSIDAKRFTVRERIPTDGMPHHPQIAIGSDGIPILVWDELLNGQRRAVMARAGTGAQHHLRFAREVLGDVAVYPVVAAAKSAAIAWTSGKSPDSFIRVEVRP